MIPFDDFVPFAPRNKGEQVHINHDTCKAGRDTRKRLYIRRTDDGDGTILAYCHNCGEHGYYREAFSKAIEARKGKSSQHNGSNEVLHTVKGKVVFPSDATGKVRDFGGAGIAWLRKYGITDEEITKNGILYSKRINRIILPVYDGHGLALYQTRRLSDDDRVLEKYKTYINRSAVFRVYGPCNYRNIDRRTLIITEDILSAIKCGRYCDSMGLLCTSLSKPALDTIIKHKYNDFIVWLDNDNRHVKLAQIALKNKLEFFGNVRIIKGLCDPKEETDKRLEEVLKDGKDN